MLKKISRENLIFFGGALLVFVVIQVAISLGFLNDFWNTILRIGAVMAIVSLGLNLIYGFNGQFSLGQWGFYAIGAYAAADITYRWYNDHSATGLAIVLLGVILVGAAILLPAQSAQPGAWHGSAFGFYDLLVCHPDPGRRLGFTWAQCDRSSAHRVASRCCPRCCSHADRLRPGGHRWPACSPPKSAFCLACRC